MRAEGERVEQVGVAEPDRDAVALDRAEHVVGGRRDRHHHRPALEQQRKDVHTHAAGAKEWSERKRHVVAAQVGDREHVDRVPRHVGVRQHDALRRAGRAGRVRHEAHVVGIDARPARVARARLAIRILVAHGRRPAPDMDRVHARRNLDRRRWQSSTIDRLHR